MAARLHELSGTGLPIAFPLFVLVFAFLVGFKLKAQWGHLEPRVMFTGEN